MSEIAFFDTNVLVYLFDSGSPAKQQRARDLLQQKAGDGEAVLSIQVLQEFYVTITVNWPLPLMRKRPSKQSKT
jgi:predicted nucleic acid-binding protein